MNEELNCADISGSKEYDPKVVLCNVDHKFISNYEYMQRVCNTDSSNITDAVYAGPSEDEKITIKNALDAMPLESLISMQRQYNLANDPGKIKAKEKRRRDNKAAKLARRVNRKNRKK